MLSTNLHPVSKPLRRKTLVYVVPKQLGLKAVLTAATVFYDFWVTGLTSDITDPRQLSRNNAQ